MFRKAVHKNESGVALLFALGILSLLLVLGLAFASNALLAQKVARTFTATAKTKTTRCLPTGCSARTIRC